MRIDASTTTIISIHAPTRGATVTPIETPLTSVISIHAPTRGATFHVLSVQATKQDFNPRSHERSDEVDLVIWDDIGISIHAPTRGAT